KPDQEGEKGKTAVIKKERNPDDDDVSVDDDDVPSEDEQAGDDGEYPPRPDGWMHPL
ncbi:unnamed protein product, partial [Pylaiella littoralis]